jgi:hypothetical protein
VGIKPVVAVACLLATLSAPDVSFADDYSWMLGVLNDNRIEGQVGAGASGNLSINSAAGDGNLQANQRALQQGVTALATIAPTSAVSSALAPNTQNPNTENHLGQVAQTEIGGQAFSHASGFLGINQVSGVGNAQLNTIVVGGAVASLGQIRATEEGATSSPLPNSTDRHAGQSGTKDSTDRYSATIGDGALSGFGGVLQINQVSGIGNVTANHFSISMP